MLSHAFHLNSKYQKLLSIRDECVTLFGAREQKFVMRIRTRYKKQTAENRQQYFVFAVKWSSTIEVYTNRVKNVQTGTQTSIPQLVLPMLYISGRINIMELSVRYLTYIIHSYLLDMVSNCSTSFIHLSYNQSI